MKTIRMTKEQHQKWDVALRSGKYEQGRGVLHNSEADAYCCLGVLQHCLTGEVEDRALPTLEWLGNNGIEFWYPDAPGPSQYPGTKMGDSVTELNDRGVPFTEIADLIAEHVEYTDDGPTDYP